MRTAIEDGEILGNLVDAHASIDIGVLSYPTAIDIHAITATSDNPTGPLGALLIAALGELGGPSVVPDLAWDGVVDPARPYDDDRICIRGNGDADFINLAWPLADATHPRASWRRTIAATPPCPLSTCDAE